MRNLFDTFKFVQRLEQDQFSRETAEAVMNSTNEVVHEWIQNMTHSCVTNTEFEKSMYMAKVDFSQLQAEVQLLEKNEFALLKADIKRLHNEADKLRQRINEETRRVQSNVRLDLSLEKGLIRDQQAKQELAIKETESRIDSEISQLKTTMETIQWDLFKTLFPIFSAAGALTFSYLRFVS
ncbi:mitochondrial protein [Gorgonomyces haynaldii]|nr:mitochondrial protein [Gorgonomyces haynaldii]